jgi:hypothetical protein
VVQEATDSLEAESTEETEENHDPESTESVLFWRGQIEAAKKAAEPQWRAAEDAWKEYLADSVMSTIQKGSTKDYETRFPIYWSSVRNIQPALYSRTPTVVAAPMLDTMDDDLSALACEAGETLAKYLIHKVPFDRVMMAARDDFIHAGKCQVQVEFDAKTETEEKKIRIFPQFGPAPTPPALAPSGPAGGMPIAGAPGIPPAAPPGAPAEASPAPAQVLIGFVDDLGKPVDLQGEQPLEDKDGLYVIQVTETLEDERLKLLPLSYKDILHTPRARNEDEITWKAVRCALTHEVVEEMFGEEAADRLPYSAKDDNTIERTGGSGKESTEVDKTTDIWEIWDKKKKTRRWLPEKGDKFLTPVNFEMKETEEETLELLKDPYDLPGFFPITPFMLGTIGPDTLYPTPDYVQLRPFILQLHAMLDRYRRVIRSAKVRGLFNGNIEELNDLNSAAPLDGDYIACHDWQGITGNGGGLEANVFHFPTAELTKAAADLSQAIQDFENKINEVWGIPDIVRGISDPNETAAAQQEKGHWFSARFSSVQREFQRVCRDACVLMFDLALKRFSEDRLRTIMGFDLRPPEDQALFPQVVALLKDTDNRPIRIEIETDSTISFNEDAEVAKRTELARTITEGIAQVQQVAQGDSDLMVLGLQSLLFVVRGLRNGKVIAEDLSAYIKKLKEPKPPAPEVPDPTVQAAQIGAQSQQAVAQIRAQTEQQIAQLKAQNELQLKQMEAQIREAQVAAEAVMEEKRIQLQSIADQAASQRDAELKQLQTQLDAAEVAAEAKIKQMQMAADVQIKTMESHFEMALEQERAKAEILKATIDMHAKMKGESTQHEARESSGPKELHVHMPPPSSRRVTQIATPEGHTVYHIENEPSA